MNIKKAILNKMAETQAVDIKENLISLCDRKLDELHKAIKNNDSWNFGFKNDTEVKEMYEYYLMLKKKINIPIEQFILLDNEEIEQDFSKHYCGPDRSFKLIK